MSAASDEGTTVLKFKAYRQQIPVELEDEGKVSTKYTLKEMMSDEKDAYLQWQNGKIKTDRDGNPIGVTDFKRFQANLVARCLFENNTGQRVTEEEIGTKFPTSVVQALFEACQKLNALTKEGAEEAKKD